MTTKLDALRKMTVVVADTGDIAAVRNLRPTDCTTNPTIVLKALQAGGAKALIGKEVAAEPGQPDDTALVNRIAQLLGIAVGVELAGVVRGRVSTEVDADLSFDTDASVARAREIVAEYARRGITRDRILIKLAATWEGIRACAILQREGIDCNMTLIFNRTQAIACADAGAFLISPFVGRILDWHVKATGRSFAPEEDPGVISVRQIYDYYKANGIATIVMGASFRSTGEIEALAGCDRLTIAPALLEALAADTGPLVRRLVPEAVAPQPRIVMDEKRFRREMNDDAMATEKLAEGIRQFTADLMALRDLVRAALAAAIAKEPVL